MSASSLDLKPDSSTEPVIKLTSQIVRDAAKLNADEIRLELDMALHLKARDELNSLFRGLSNKTLTFDRFDFEISKLPNALNVIYVMAGERHQMPSANGELFGNITKILLLAAGIQPWTKGEISAPIETVNPISKWMLESKDLSWQLQLRRIRAT